MLSLGRNIVLLWQGQLISQLGTHIFNIARVYWLVETLQKGRYVGALLTLCSLVFTVFAPLGGFAADYYRRKHIVIFSDIVSGLAMFSLAFSMFFVDSIAINTGVLFITSAIVSASTAFFTPAVQAAIPNMVATNQLAAANAAIASSAQIGQVLGQGLGGTLIAILGIPLMILVNGISLILSAITELFIDFKQKRPRQSDPLQPRSAFAHIVHAIKDGFASIKASPTVKILVWYTALDGFLLVPIFVITPYLASCVYGGGASFYGYLIGLFSLGTIGGYAIAPRLNHHRGLLKLLFFARGLSMLIIGLLPVFSMGLLAFFLIGCAEAIITVKIHSYIQMITDNHLLGRVFGLMNSLSNILVPLSFAIAGWGLDLPGVTVGFQFTAYGIAAFVLATWVLSQGVFKRKDWREKSAN